MTEAAQPGADRSAHRAPARARRGVVLSGLAAVLLVLAGCAFGPPPPDQSGAPPRLPTPSAAPVPSDDSQATVAVLAKGLAVPWGMAFLPDGSALVTERDTGRILRVGPQQGPDGLVVTPVQTIPGVRAAGDGGLLGIAVSPGYRTDATVFIYYTTATDNRIARLRLGGAPQPIVTGIPAGTTGDGGWLAFGPDGYLYAGTGDAGSPGSAQDQHSHGGKILRLTAAGKPAPGNPYPGSPVWASGFHDVTGFAWSARRRMYATDTGGSTDEVNAILPGHDYGWPAVAGTGKAPSVTNPMQTFAPTVASCSGTAVLGEVLTVACLTGQRLYLLQLTAAGDVLGAPSPALVGTYGRLRGVVVAPDGTLWVTTSNRDGHGTPRPGDDRILRVVIDSSGGAANT